MEFSKPFNITSVCKDDILGLINDIDDEKDKNYYTKILEKMDEDHMNQIASKLADDYCEQLFLDSLSVIFFEIFAYDFAKELNIEEEHV